MIITNLESFINALLSSRERVQIVGYSNLLKTHRMKNKYMNLLGVVVKTLAPVLRRRKTAITALVM